MRVRAHAITWAIALVAAVIVRSMLPIDTATAGRGRRRHRSGAERP